jgi:flagellin
VGKEDTMSGTLNSINTNTGAMVALESLDQTNVQLNVAQNEISTGYRVSSPVDDGAAYAVAQSVRSDVSALTTANQQLGGAQGLLSTTTSSLNDISNLMSSMRDVLLDLANGNTAGDERSQYAQQYNSYLSNLRGYIEDSSYNGTSLINDLGSNTISALSVIRNEVGSTYTLVTYSGSGLYNSVAFTSTQLAGPSTVAALITATGTFMNQFNDVSTEMNTYGAATNYVNNQVNYNTDKIDALNSGLGALIDADLAQESATLQSLQIQQQLATQALTLADQSPTTLLTLVKNA